MARTTLQIRCSAEEHQSWKDRAGAVGVTLTDAVRVGLEQRLAELEAEAAEAPGEFEAALAELGITLD